MPDLADPASTYLIAAAPDLLAVVRDLATVTTSTRAEPPDAFIRALSEIGPRAVAALAKAEGRIVTAKGA